MQRILQLHPSLVILSESDGPVAYRARQTRVGNHLVPAQEWEEGLGSTISYFDSRGLKTLAISDVPRAGFDVPICLSRAAPTVGQLGIAS